LRRVSVIILCVASRSMMSCSAPSKKDLAVVDDDDPVAQLLNVLHVVGSEQRGDPVARRVFAEKFAHLLL